MTAAQSAHVIRLDQIRQASDVRLEELMDRDHVHLRAEFRETRLKANVVSFLE